MLRQNHETRVEINITVNDRLTKEQLEAAIKRCLEDGIRRTSYGIKVDSVHEV